MPHKNYDREIAAIKRDMAGLAERLSEVGGEAVEDVQESASEYYDQAKETAENAWEKTKEVGRKSKKYVEDHPWQSVAVGVAAGLLVGMLLGRKHHG